MDDDVKAAVMTMSHALALAARRVCETTGATACSVIAAFPNDSHPSWRVALCGMSAQDTEPDQEFIDRVKAATEAAFGEPEVDVIRETTHGK